MTRDTRAVIRLDALQHNLDMARKAAPGARVMAVVKANGYGHGLLRVARAMRCADAFAVTSLDEAIPLREAGFAHPILLLEGLFEPRELDAFSRYRLDMVVHSDWQLEVILGSRTPRPLSVWLKVDSGMHRLGFAPEAVPAVASRLQASRAVSKHIRFITHLACADDRDDTTTEAQVHAFDRATVGLAGERSIANSAGLLAWPETRGDWVRPGIMLYGASPFVDGRESPQPLRPVMTLGSRLVAINHFRKGDRIGYGGSWACPEDMPVGVVAIGYGDGYPRHAPSGTPVLVGGHRTQLVGRVSMDMICVDLRGIEPEVDVGEPVVLWGEGLPVEEVARWSGTISYELLCGLTGRVRFEEISSSGGSQG